MDNIARHASDLTTPDRAERARIAWELYRDLHGDKIEYLIADLMHLADVDEHPGGGAHAARRAVAHYVGEGPTWPVEPQAPLYLAQYRPKGGDWITVAEGDDSVELRDVANCLWRLMQKHGFYTSEIALHIDDIVRGDVLTAENGAEFRAFKNPDYRG
ncbi:hypothetical protein ACWDBD_36715 [Streptomyces sp. NPDC001118]